MSKLNIDQTSVMELFRDRKADFLIPDYQRPYAWGENECTTLWEDIFAFAFPDDNTEKFDDRNDEYFLGPIVTFINDDRKKEIIDGQQRLTTLMLLLRAFYAKFGNMMDSKAISTAKAIEQCIWKTDEFGEPDKTQLKINSEVATDNDKEEFLNILKTGKVLPEHKSAYAKNYRLFQKLIDEFLNKYPSYFAHLPIRILNNCILLPIEAESQDTALRIFSTLNDRGKPLSDADIFKAQFYKYYSNKGEKDKFIEKWKNLEELCEKIFHPIQGTPMDEIFTRYMYFERAKMGIKSSTTEALRKFYEKDNYSLLKNDNTFENLIILADFWNDISNQDKERFSEKVLRQLYVLNYAPNGMWTYFVSVYFMKYKDENNNLDDKSFTVFLDIITAFIFTYAITNPGVNALRTPVYAEMVNIIADKAVTFEDYKFQEDTVRNIINNYSFTNGRPITKSLLTWWAFTNDNQELLSLESVYEIEHIFARKRQEMEGSLTRIENLESLGNKAILEKKINIRASDYRFTDKIKYYKGYTNSKNQEKEGTRNRELINFAENQDDFTETDIVNRYNAIVDRFIEFLKKNHLVK